jgi:hypothetical protein
MDNQINELSEGGRPIISQINITSGLRRKKGSLAFLISLPEHRIPLKTQ